MSYMMPSLLCSGAMELAVPDHQEQIGGIGHTKEFGQENLHIASLKNALHFVLNCIT